MYPGQESDVTDTVDVDVCEDTNFTTTTDNIIDEHSNGIP